MRFLKYVVLVVGLIYLLPMSAVVSFSSIVKELDPNPPGNPPKVCAHSGQICGIGQTCCEVPHYSSKADHACIDTTQTVTDCCLDRAHYCYEYNGEKTYCNYIDYQGQKLFAGCVTQSGKKAYF
jgi:hypothetical protein